MKYSWAIKFFLYIDPFIDGNGRVARILTRWILKSFDSPLYFSIVGNRKDYIKSLMKEYIDK